MSLHQVFADHSHSGSIRQVAIGGKVLASGATDEMIRIFNLATRTEVGIVMEHQGKLRLVMINISEAGPSDITVKPGLEHLIFDYINVFSEFENH